MPLPKRLRPCKRCVFLFFPLPNRSIFLSTFPLFSPPSFPFSQRAYALLQQSISASAFFSSSGKNRKRTDNNQVSGIFSPFPYLVFMFLFFSNSITFLSLSLDSFSRSVTYYLSFSPQRLRNPLARSPLFLWPATLPLFRPPLASLVRKRVDFLSFSHGEYLLFVFFILLPFLPLL